MTTLEERKKRALVGGGAAMVLAGAFAAGRAAASDVQGRPPLQYSGVLLDARGTPLPDAEHSIEVQLSSAPNESGLICTTGGQSVALRAGHFSVTLPDSCVDLIGPGGAVYTQVVMNKTGLGWARGGAVPFAIEAVRSDTARTAANATGSLEERLAGLERNQQALQEQQSILASRLGVDSAFKVYLTTRQMISPGNFVKVAFDAEAFDRNDEFDLAQHVFTVRSPGRYLVACSLQFAALSGASSQGWGVNIRVNGLLVQHTQLVAPDYYPVVNTSGVLDLASADQVVCEAYQGGSVPIPLAGAPEPHVSFSAARLPD